MDVANKPNRRVNAARVSAPHLHASPATSCVPRQYRLQQSRAMTWQRPNLHTVPQPIHVRDPQLWHACMLALGCPLYTMYVPAAVKLMIEAAEMALRIGLERSPKYRAVLLSPKAASSSRSCETRGTTHNTLRRQSQSRGVCCSAAWMVRVAPGVHRWYRRQ